MYPAGINYYDPENFSDSQLVEECLDGIPSWLYDALVPEYYNLQEQFFAAGGCLDFLLKARGNLDVAITRLTEIVERLENGHLSQAASVLARLQSLKAQSQSQ